MKSPILGDNQLLPVSGMSPTAWQALDVPYSQTPAPGVRSGGRLGSFQGHSLGLAHLRLLSSPLKAALTPRGRERNHSSPSPVTPKGRRGWGGCRCTPSGFV